MSFGLIKIDYQRLQNLLNSRTSSAQEFEIRLGSLHDQKFNANVKQSYFNHILKVLLGEELYKERYASHADVFETLSPVEKSVVHFYDKEGYRQINIIGDNKEILKKIYQKKNEVSEKYDVDFYFYAVRFSLASEENISPSEFKNLTETFTRTRTRYIIKGKEFELHLTKVERSFSKVEGKKSYTSYDKGDKTTYEIEIEFNNKVKDVVDVLRILTSTLIMTYDSPTILTSNELNQLQDYIKKLFGKMKPNQPKDLTYERFSNLERPYYSTNKLDGLRKFLIIPKHPGTNSVFILINATGIKPQSPSSLIRFISKSPLQYSGYVFDGEYLDTDSTYHIFDVLWANDHNVTKEPFSQRLTHINPNILSELNKNQFSQVLHIHLKTFRLYPKPFKTTFISTMETLIDMRNIFGIVDQKTKTLDLKATAKEVLTYNDGIIYNPAQEPYVTKVETLKYKFPQRLSFDVKLIEDERKSSRDLRIFNLYTYKEDNEEVKIPDVPPLLVKPHDNLGFLHTGMIVEVGWNKRLNQIYFLKIREDKKKPNPFGIIVKDILTMIKTPLTVIKLLNSLKLSMEKDLRSKDIKINDQLLDESYKLAAEIDSTILYEQKEIKEGIITEESLQLLEEETGEKMAKTEVLKGLTSENNQIKGLLIKEYAKGKKILDIGFGRGGDIMRYGANMPATLYAVEPDKSNIKNAEKRLTTSREGKDYETKMKAELYRRIHLINKDILELNSTDLLEEDLGKNKKFDVIFSFLSMTFFFESPEKLKKLTDLIKNRLASGGYFIVYTVDGDLVQKYLKNTPSNQKKEIDKSYYMIKEYDNENVSIGKKIKIHLPGTIVGDQTEYLAFFDILKQYLQPLELKKTVLQKVDRFDLTPAEKELAELNRYAIFQKVTIDLDESKFPPLKIGEIKPLPVSTLKEEKLMRLGSNIKENNLLGAILLGYIFEEMIRLKFDRRKFEINRIKGSIENHIYVYDWIFYDINAFQSLISITSEKLSNVVGFKGKFLVESIMKHVEMRVMEKKSLQRYLNVFFESYTITKNKYPQLPFISLEKLSQIVSDAVSLSIKNFIQQLSTINSSSIMFYSDYFKVNIYVLSDPKESQSDSKGDSLAPHQFDLNCYQLYDPSRGSIILFQNGPYYETVGNERMKTNVSSLVTYFPPRDPLIKQLNSMIECLNHSHKYKHKPQTINKFIADGFPSSDKVDYSLIKSNPEVKYSLTFKEDAQKISDKIKELVGSSNIIIMDATSGGGGNVISFALNFPTVIAIEIDKDMFDILSNNVIKAYKLTNVDLKNEDSTKAIYEHKHNVLFLDPPWGGRDYKDSFDIHLRLGDYDIVDLLKKYLTIQQPKLIVIKVPFNYNKHDIETLKVLGEKFEIVQHYYKSKLQYNIIYIINPKKLDPVQVVVSTAASSKPTVVTKYKRPRTRYVQK